MPPAGIDTILVTHAHTDHVGYLPALVRDEFEGDGLATAATCELAAIVLRDAAFLAERDAAFLAERDAEHAASHGYSRHDPPLPLFTAADVERTLGRFREVEYDTDVDLGDGVVAR